MLVLGPWLGVRPEEESSVAGKIADASGEALAFVRIDLFQGDEVMSSEVTDQAGTFDFEGLAPGYYCIQASRTGFLSTRFSAGQKHVWETPLALGAGQKIDIGDLHLERASTISGVVWDETGQPIVGLSVGGIDVSAADSPVLARLVMTGTDGKYQLNDLAPGLYQVAAAPSASRHAFGDLNAAIGPGRQQVLTYYPGVTRRTSVQPLKLGRSDELKGIGIAIQTAPAVTVSGSLPPGPWTTPKIMALPEPSALLGWADIAADRAVIDGSRFSIRLVSADEYHLEFRAREMSGDAWVTASRDVEPAEADVTGVSVLGRDVSSIQVSTATRIDGPLALCLEPYQIETPKRAIESRAADLHITSDDCATIDSTQSHAYIPARETVAYRLRPDRPWSLQSAVRNGELLSDGVIPDASRLGSDVVNVSVTKHPAAISGFVLGGSESVVDEMVVLLARVEGQLRVTRLAAVATDGSFVVSGVPSGSYVLAAVPETTPDDMHETSETLGREGQPINVTAQGVRMVLTPLHATRQRVR